VGETKNFIKVLARKRDGKGPLVELWDGTAWAVGKTKQNEVNYVNVRSDASQGKRI
jgi:hypothetical protein